MVAAPLSALFSCLKYSMPPRKVNRFPHLIRYFIIITNFSACPPRLFVKKGQSFFNCGTLGCMPADNPAPGLFSFVILCYNELLAADRPDPRAV